MNAPTSVYVYFPFHFEANFKNIAYGPQQPGRRMLPITANSSYVRPISASSVCTTSPSFSGRSSAVGIAAMILQSKRSARDWWEGTHVCKCGNFQFSWT